MTSGATSHVGVARSERIRAPLELSLPSSRHQLVWRELTMADNAQFVSLMVNSAETGLDAVELAAPKLERLVMGAPDGGPLTLGGFDRAGVLRAAAALELWPPPEAGTLVLHGAVDPDWSERGIGRAMMAWQEGRGRQILAELPGSGPAEMVTYVPEVAAGRRRLLMAAGFSAHRSFERVRRDLQAPVEDWDLPDGLIWRSKAEMSSEQVRLAHNLTSGSGWAPGPIFRDLWEERWPDYRPDWASFAVHAETGEIAGYALAISHEQSWAGVPRQEAIIHRIGVVPAYRRHGVGRALLARTLWLIAGAEEPPRFAAAMVDPAQQFSGARMLEAFGFAPSSRVMVYALSL